MAALPQNLDYPKSDEEASKRYAQHESIDPYPEISAALLNSADISDYVKATGMVYPFDETSLKPASYGIPLLGKCIVWNLDGEKIIEQIGVGNEFCLQPNSISFVTLQSYFRLPDYIAARFDLAITHIYRGLILGTGPLIDPGFCGKLSVPIHNLTLNPYTLRGGERLIWVEFTKLSQWKKWESTEPIQITRSGEYVPFPYKKRLRYDLEDYLYEAEPHRPIMSSIPTAIQIAAERADIASRKADQAEKHAKELSTRIQIAGVVSALAIFLTIAALIFRLIGLYQNSVNYVNDAKEKYDEVLFEQTVQAQTIEDAQATIESLEKQVDSLNQNYQALQGTSTP